MMLQKQEEERLRTHRSVKVTGISDDITVARLSAIFSKYGTLDRDYGVTIRKCERKSIDNYAVITFILSEQDDWHFHSMALEVRDIDGHRVSLIETKSGGKYANGVAHISMPGPEDLTDSTTGTQTITVVSCTIDASCVTPLLKPYC